MPKVPLVLASCRSPTRFSQQVPAQFFHQHLNRVFFLSYVGIQKKNAPFDF